MQELVKAFRIFDILGHLMPGTLFSATLYAIMQKHAGVSVPLPKSDLAQGVIFVVFAYASGLFLSSLSMYSFWFTFSWLEGKSRPYLKILWRPTIELLMIKNIVAPPTDTDIKNLCARSYQMVQTLAGSPHGSDPLLLAGSARLLGSCGLICLLIPCLFDQHWIAWAFAVAGFLLFHLFAYFDWVFYREYVAIKVYMRKYGQTNETGGPTEPGR